MIGRTLSHYQVLEEISRGGMGIVYRARDTKLDREVALKVLPPDLLRDERRKRRFVTEAKAAAKMQDPAMAVAHELDAAPPGDAPGAALSRARRGDRRGPFERAREGHRAPGLEPRQPHGDR